MRPATGNFVSPFIWCGQGTTVDPMVGMNWHCISVVVTCPKIVVMMLPDPVSAIAVSVVGPSGLRSGRGWSVTLPDLPVVRFTHVALSGSFCSSGRAGRTDRGEHVGGLAGLRAGQRDGGRAGH